MVFFSCKCYLLQTRPLSIIQASHTFGKRSFAKHQSDLKVCYSRILKNDTIVFVCKRALTERLRVKISAKTSGWFFFFFVFWAN